MVQLFLCFGRWPWISSLDSSGPATAFIVICQCCPFPLHCFFKSEKGALNIFQSYILSLISSAKDLYLKSMLNTINCHCCIKLKVAWTRLAEGKSMFTSAPLCTYGTHGFFVIEQCYNIIFHFSKLFTGPSTEIPGSFERSKQKMLSPLLPELELVSFLSVTTTRVVTSAARE